MKTMATEDFEAHCLSEMDEVNASREPLLLTKGGKPIVQLVPLEQGELLFGSSSRSYLRSKPLPLREGEDPLAIFRFPGLKIVGDIVSPASDLNDWEESR